MLNLSYNIKNNNFLVRFDIEICNSFLQKLKTTFSKSMREPTFSKSSFLAKICCSEKLFLVLPNSFSPAFRQKDAVAVANSNPRHCLSRCDVTLSNFSCASFSIYMMYYTKTGNYILGNASLIPSS